MSRLPHGLGDALVLLDSHPHGLVLQGERVLIGLLTLGEQLGDLGTMLVVVGADLFYLLDESVANILVKVLHIEVLVLLVEVLQQSGLILDLLVDSQECGDLLGQDMDEVLVGQIFQEDLASFSAVVC